MDSGLFGQYLLVQELRGDIGAAGVKGAGSCREPRELHGLGESGELPEVQDSVLFLKGLNMETIAYSDFSKR